MCGANAGCGIGNVFGLHELASNLIRLANLRLEQPSMKAKPGLLTV
jgi:hypothetical protein